MATDKDGMVTLTREEVALLSDPSQLLLRDSKPIVPVTRRWPSRPRMFEVNPEHPLAKGGVFSFGYTEE